MSQKTQHRPGVFLDSGGVKLLGYYYRPAHATGEVSCVVMGHGFSGTQDRLVVSAERFA
jgi:cephalosporin-C deacetylase-like acetyl esterase